MTSKRSKSTVRQFAAACRRVAEAGLVSCSSGNMSWRLDEERMLVKASRFWMGEMTGAGVSVCRIADGKVLEGPRPSVETGFHAGILRDRPDVNVVLHFQSPFATALACRKGRLAGYAVTPEIPFYIGRIAEISYFPPGSAELAAAVIRATRQHNLSVLQNHGQVTVAADFPHAFQNARFFELACSILVRCGDQVRLLSPRAVAALMAAGAGKRPGAA